MSNTTPKHQRPLSSQQVLFCRKFVHLNKMRDAAIAAGYSPKSAHNSANRLVKDSRIKALIASLKAASEQTVVRRELIDKDRLEAELEYAATADVRRLFNEDGRLKGPLELDEATARSVATMKVYQPKEGAAVIADIKMIDKTTAIKMLGQQKGMFKDTTVHEHKLKDMSTAELEAELARLKGHSTEITEAAAAHGVTLN